jgi:tetratricopeptide (TPR) repeat protein
VNQSVDPDHFVQAVEPLLAANDLQGLHELLKSRWTVDQLAALLVGSHSDARKVAALAMALVGCRSCVNKLADLLREPDPMLNELAEHALWSIWFRLGCCKANHEVCRGSRAMARQELDLAVEHFTRAICLDPDFAEAYNQRAIAAYMQERYEDAIGDCRRTVELMPCHFGAWSGMGHCYAHLQRPVEAIDCYEKALQINPHLSCVAEAVSALRRQPTGSSAARF